jgi:hypothetical protein
MHKVREANIGAVKIYVTVVQALREKERQCETQKIMFMTKLRVLMLSCPDFTNNSIV